MAAARGWLVAGPAVLAALTACGWSSPSSPPSPGYWTAEPFVEDAPFHTPHWWGEVVVPSAENASLDMPADREQAHHVLFIRADGFIEALRDCGTYRGGYRRTYRGGYDVGQDDVATVLTGWTEVGDQSCSTTWPLYVLVAADRQAPWRRVRDVLDAVARLDVPSREVRLAVSEWPSARAHHLAMDLRPSAGHGSEASGDVAVRITEGGGERGVTVEIDERSWVFPPTSQEFGDEDFLAAANGIWAEVKTGLDHAFEGKDRAQVRIRTTSGSLRFAYVVSILDLLLGAGVPEVALDEEGLCLTMKEPTGEAWPVDAPAIGWWMLTVSVAAVLLAFLLNFPPRWPSRGRRTPQPPM